MPRAKGGFKSRRRRNKVLKLAKGYRGARSKLYRSAVEAVDRALNYAFRDRKAKKRDNTEPLWVVDPVDGSAGFSAGFGSGFLSFGFGFGLVTSGFLTSTLAFGSSFGASTFGATKGLNIFTL